MADDPVDVWLKPYEQAKDTEAAMNAYLSWEVDLLDRIKGTAPRTFARTLRRRALSLRILALERGILYLQMTQTMKGNMLKSLRGFFAVLSVAVSTGFAAPAGAQDTIKVAVGQIDAWANQVPTLGMKAGIFQKHGIVLESYGTQGAGETLQAVISGSADIGIGVGTPGAMRAFAKAHQCASWPRPIPVWKISIGLCQPFRRSKA